MGIKITDYTPVSQSFIDTDLLDISKHVTQTSGALTIGKQYTILDFNAGDNFTNVAQIVSGVINTTGCVFIATGTTPTTYSNGSIIAYYMTQSATWAQIKSAANGGEIYTEVDISFAEILTMGTSRVELLPTPSAGNYYDVKKIIFEYNFKTIPYALVDDWIQTFGCDNIFMPKGLIESSFSRYAIGSSDGSGFIDSLENIKYSNVTIPAVNLELGTYADNNPTAGDGTIKVKIWYSIVTFG